MKTLIAAAAALLLCSPAFAQTAPAAKAAPEAARSAGAASKPDKKHLALARKIAALRKKVRALAHADPAAKAQLLAKLDQAAHDVLLPAAQAPTAEEEQKYIDMWAVDAAAMDGYNSSAAAVEK